MRVELILEAIDRATRPIKAVANALLGVERAAKAGQGISKIGQGLGIATQRAAGLAVVATGAAAGLAASMVDTASAFETMQTALITTEGSQDKARKAMSWVSDFATKTPYDLMEVNKAFVSLRSAGLDPTNGMLQTLGDTSASLNLPLMQSVEAMKDAVVGQNERLLELGIRASVNKKLDKVTYSYSDLAGVTHEVTAKLSDQADIAEKLSGIFDGKFGGSMARLAKTWEGTITNLQDAWGRFQLAVMNAGLFDWMKSKAELALATVNRMTDDGSLERLATEIGQTIQKILVFAWELGTGIVSAVQAIAPYVSAIVDFVGGARNAMLLLGGLTMLKPILLIAQGIGLLVSALVPLAPALMVAAGAARAFGVAMMTNPIGLVVAAIIALVAAGYYLYQNWAQIGPWLANLWASIKSAAVNAWNGLIAWFASLGGRIGSALSGAWSSVTSWFASIQWPSLPPMGDVLAAIRAPFEAASQWVSGWIADAASWFSTFVWPKLPAIGNILADIQSALEPVIGWIEEWGTRLLGAFTTVFDKIGGFIGGAVTKISSAFSKVGGFLASTSEMVFGPSAASVSASAEDIAKVSASAEAARGLINAIPSAAQNAVSRAGQILASANFHSHGVAMMTTLAEGIKAGAASAVAAVRATVQQVRDLLPHSPAKVGPLNDLDRVQFGQTLAGAINDGAPKAIAAARAIAAGLAATIPVGAAYGATLNAPAPPVMATVARPQFASASPTQAGGANSNSNISVNLTLAPNINGGSGDIVAQIRAALPQIGHELAETLRAELDRRDRTKH